jgi:hypothetical protein
MKLGYLKLIGKQFLINEEGYYFDFIIKKIDNKYFTSIDKLNENDIQIIKYPTYESILDNFDKLINSNAIVLLYKTQKKEIKLISTYFKKIDLPFNTTQLMDFLEIDNFSIDEILKQAKTNPLFRLIYVFIKTKHIFNLNTSRLYKINKENLHLIFTKSDFILIDNKQFPNAYLYYNKSLGYFDLSIFIDLLFYDLEKYSDERIDYILQLIKFNNFSEIDINKLNINKDIIKKYSKEIAWIKRDGKIFMMGGLS